jgi:DNA helicase-2/ATP-dependent DNA helicase PcrA
MRKITLKSKGGDRLGGLLARDLNPSQLAAATAPDGYNLILAGPGSGKTRVITYRVAHLISRGVPADSILLVTFTRRASREMLGRLETLIGGDATRVWAGTFHHVGNRILRRYAETLGFAPNFTILDSEDQEDLVRLAMDDAGLFGREEFSPKPSQVLHLLSYAFNVARPLAEIVAEKAPSFTPCVEAIDAASRHYAERKCAANCMDYDDLLGQWARLVRDFPEARRAIAGRFRHLLIDEMQDTNSVQAGLIETLAREGAGNLTAVGDDAQSIYGFRGANYDNILKFAERNPTARVFTLDVNYRSTPQIVAFTADSIAHNTTGFAKRLVSARPDGMRPVLVPAENGNEEAEFVCQQVLEWHEQGIGLSNVAVLYRNHYDSVLLQAELVARGIPYTVRSGLRFFEQAHVKDVLAYLRVIVNGRDEAAWRRLLLLLPGIGPAKSAAIYERLAAAADPLAALATAETMKLIPPKGKGHFAGFVSDLRKIQAISPETHPADAISAILQGGYPAVVRDRYERPDQRIADLEQLAVLGAKYDSLERLIADLLLAGDVYGADTVAGEEPEEHLVLSSIHQSKGLEWSRVFVIRLVEDGFPNARALNEPGGEDEERRIFYVAITRAKDELFLTYPLLLHRGSWAGTVVARPSRFITEVDQALLEPVVLEHEDDR